MRTIPVQTFGKKYFQNLKAAPLVITAKGKKRWIVLPYSKVMESSMNTPMPGASLNGTAFAYEHGSLAFEDPPTLFSRIKSILTRKVF